MNIKDLRQVTVIGLGLLGSSITLAVKGGNFGIKAAGFSHRESTRKRARKLEVADIVYSDILESVADADVVILATPICTFEEIFKTIRPALKKGCIVTDVGSTKVLPHKWAKKTLPACVNYVGSHPIAGSEQRGVEFGRDDLFYGAACILTEDASTDKSAAAVLKKFWSLLGCRVYTMAAAKHDKILSNVSHLPHATAAALLNASDSEQLKHCGKGFIDTSRVASGPANVWSDIFITNAENIEKGIEKLIKELVKIKKAVKHKKKIEKLLEQARQKRAKLIEYKVSKKEIL
ncbi:MAG: prephenate dehydrogenase/arogenate dehydrogenase family protein [Planctomycetaceae bacterium]|nr:prephenate dehydrogenase/arogenate dehydrogenase family protein [Planctomycetaceae bacterium]